MKKIIIFAIAILITLMYTGCNSCTQMYKEFESDFAELDRDVTVMHAFTGDTLFHYSGPCYFSKDTAGGVTLIYKDNGKSKKADWTGNFIFQAIEK